MNSENIINQSKEEVYANRSEYYLLTISLTLFSFLFVFRLQFIFFPLYVTGVAPLIILLLSRWLKVTYQSLLTGERLTFKKHVTEEFRSNGTRYLILSILESIVFVLIVVVYGVTFNYFTMFLKQFGFPWFVAIFPITCMALLFLLFYIPLQAFVLTPFIIQDNPEYSALESIQKSHQMMVGNKWRLVKIRIRQYVPAIFTYMVLTVLFGVLSSVPYENVDILLWFFVTFSFIPSVVILSVPYHVYKQPQAIMTQVLFYKKLLKEENYMQG